MSYYARIPNIPLSNVGTRAHYFQKRVLRYKGSAAVITNVPSKPIISYPRISRKTGWTANSVRSGVIGRKIGMTAEWDEWGALRPITLIQIEQNHVAEIKTEDIHGYTALKIGAGDIKLKQMNRAQMGICAHAGIPPKRAFVEFKVTPDAILPVGTKITAMHFQPGQRVNVRGISKGKGTQGVMKRWGFKGGSASHGNSLAHRTPGSTGQRQNPSRVFPGKKMPGRMGNEKITEHNLFVFAVYPKKNVIAVVGGVPGASNGRLQITDTGWYKWLTPPPFPTWIKPTPRNDVIKGRNPESPWWREPKISSPKIMKQLVATQLKKLEDNPIMDETWAKLIKDEVNRHVTRKWGGDVKDKDIAAGAEVLEQKKRETELAKALARGERFEGINASLIMQDMNNDGKLQKKPKDVQKKETK